MPFRGLANVCIVPTTLKECSRIQQLSFPWHQPFQQLQQARRASSLLSYEEVSAGSPTAEHPTAPPSRTLLVLHGLLGCGRNWRTWARRLVEAAAASNPPEGGPWRALLLDLRCHGASTHRPGLHPPNNMLSAAEDVSRLVRHLMGSQAPGGILGHSMGGKVALALLQQAAAHANTQGHHHHHHHHHHKQSHQSHHQQQQQRRPVPPESMVSVAVAAAPGEWCAPPRQLWVLDSQPGLVTAEQDAGTGISRVLNTVHSVPLPIPSRAWLLRHLRDGGLSDALANWLASNLVVLPAHQQQQQQPRATAYSAHPHTPPGETRGTFDQPQHQHQQQQHLKQQQHQHQHQQQQHLKQQQHQHHQPQQYEGQRQQTPGAGAAGGGAGGPFTWSFDIQCAGAMYMSYRTTEFWQVLENPPYGTAVHLVQGARSDRWPEAMQRRLTETAAAAATTATTTTAATVITGAGCSRGSFEHHVLERAGHWLHVDNPEGLLRLVLPRLTGL